MISLNRILKLRDLEIFHVLKNGSILSYVVIEDTRNPFTEEDIKLEPLCYMDEEDINKILNVFRISLINDEKLNEEDSILLKNHLRNQIWIFQGYTESKRDGSLYVSPSNPKYLISFARLLLLRYISKALLVMKTENWNQPHIHTVVKIP